MKQPQPPITEKVTILDLALFVYAFFWVTKNVMEKKVKEEPHKPTFEMVEMFGL